MCFCFLAVNLTTGTRSPTVWIDEALLTDPAANLLLEGRFRSSAGTQPEDEFFADTVPLYPLVLYLWIRVFGLDVLSVRALSYVMMVGVAALLYYLVMRRFKLISNRYLGLFLVLCILCGDGVTYSYRTARWDCLGMAVAAAVAWAASLKSPRIRYCLLAFFAALVPWTSVSMGIFFACFAALILVATRGALWREIAAIGTGAFLGLILLLGLYRSQGVLEPFMTAVFSRSGMKVPWWSVASRLLVDAARDPSRVLLGLALLLALAGREKGRRITLSTPSVLGLLIVLVLPVPLSVLRGFSRYYSWMAYIPATFLLGIELERALERRARIAWFLVLLMSIACLVGLPARVAVVLAEWQERDYAPVERFVEEQLRPGDVALVDYAFFYPAKRAADRVYLPSRPLLPVEAETVSVLVWRTKQPQSRLTMFGHEWDMVASRTQSGESFLRRMRLHPGARLYGCAVYRRPAH